MAGVEVLCATLTLAACPPADWCWELGYLIHKLDKILYFYYIPTWECSIFWAFMALKLKHPNRCFKFVLQLRAEHTVTQCKCPFNKSTSHIGLYKVPAEGEAAEVGSSALLLAAGLAVGNPLRSKTCRYNFLLCEGNILLGVILGRRSLFIHYGQAP